MYDTYLWDKEKKNKKFATLFTNFNKPIPVTESNFNLHVSVCCLTYSTKFTKSYFSKLWIWGCFYEKCSIYTHNC